MDIKEVTPKEYMEGLLESMHTCSSALLTLIDNWKNNGITLSKNLERLQNSISRLGNGGWASGYESPRDDCSMDHLYRHMADSNRFFAKMCDKVATISPNEETAEIMILQCHSLMLSSKWALDYGSEFVPYLMFKYGPTLKSRKALDVRYATPRTLKEKASKVARRLWEEGSSLKHHAMKDYLRNHYEEGGEKIFTNLHEKGLLATIKEVAIEMDRTDLITGYKK